MRGRFVVFLTPLLAAQTATFEIAAGETRPHVLRVEQGQFAEAAAKQLSGNVEITVKGPSGKVIGTMDRTIRYAVERLPWIARTTGEYTVEIRSAKPAMYALTLEIRPAGERENALAEAFRAGLAR